MAENAQAATGFPQQESYTPTAYQRLSHHDHPHTVTSCAIKFCTLMALIVINIFIILLFFFILFCPQLPDFSVTDATLSLYNSYGSQLTANWEVKVTISNGNKYLGVKYQYVTAALGDKDHPLAATTLPPFYQGKQNTTTIPVHLAIHLGNDSMKVSESTSGQLKFPPGGGMAYFNVQLQSAMQYKSGRWHTWWRTLKVYCDSLEIDWVQARGNPVVGRLNSVCQCVGIVEFDAL